MVCEVCQRSHAICTCGAGAAAAAGAQSGAAAAASGADEEPDGAGSHGGAQHGGGDGGGAQHGGDGDEGDAYAHDEGGEGSSEEEDEEDEDAALFAALVQDRRAAAERAMQDPIDHADLELAVAGAGRFSLQLSDTLDDAHGRLINWRKDELRTMWEFADAAHFFRCFHTDDLLVSLPKCDVSDLEKLLLDTSSNGQAGPLHIALMKLVWPRAAVREDNWFSMLLAKLAERPGLVEGSWDGALHMVLINEEEDDQVAADLEPSHGCQTIRTKVMLLHALVHLVMDDKNTGVMGAISGDPESWTMRPDCWYEDDSQMRHEFYYFTGEPR